MISHRTTLFAVAAGCFLSAVIARAQIAVSSNDNKAVWVNGVNTVPPNPRPDTVSILDLGSTPPRLLAELDAQGGWSAPPQSVAVAPDESIALVTSGARLDPADPKRTVFNNVLSVIDLKAQPPRLIATLETGQRAAGVSISPSGRLALVANRAEGTVSVFSINGRVVTPAGKVDLKAPDSAPSLPVFTPDGSRALVTLNNGHRVAMLAIDGDKVEYTGRDIASGLSPYAIEVVPDGRVAIVANIGNGPTGGSDTLQVIDLTMNPPRVVDGIFVGIVPEGIAISPDGRFVAAALQNGAHLAAGTPWRGPNGVVKIYAIDGTRLTFVTEAPTGRWGQGLAWNRAGTTLLVQAAADNRIDVFGFDGHRLTLQPVIRTSGSPTGLRTAQSAPRVAAVRTTNDGVFTTAQAEWGKVLFSDVCSVCHPDPLWRPSWQGRPVAELYDKISKLMPDDNPGTLRPDEVTSAIAYILSSNGAKAGMTPLPADPAELQGIRVEPGTR